MYRKIYSCFLFWKIEMRVKKVKVKILMEINLGQSPQSKRNEVCNLTIREQ